MGWTVRRIQENDYGCEERTDKESGQVIVTLVSEEGYERQILADDDWLYANEIDEGDRWPLKFESVISPEVGLLCCGACNLQYDRDELVSRLPGLLPEAHLVKAKSGVFRPEQEREQHYRRCKIVRENRVIVASQRFAERIEERIIPC